MDYVVTCFTKADNNFNMSLTSNAKVAQTFLKLTSYYYLIATVKRSVLSVFINLHCVESVCLYYGLHICCQINSFIILK